MLTGVGHKFLCQNFLDFWAKTGYNTAVLTGLSRTKEFGAWAGKRIRPSGHGF